MKIFQSFDEAGKVGDIRRLAVGFFDGVHRGHQLVFDAVTAAPCDFSILTFWPHPQTILAPEHAPRLITGLDHKLRLFAAAGASSTLVIPFDTAFSHLAAGQFLSLLETHLSGLRAVACGPNFHFGRNRQGTAQQLQAWALGRGLTAPIPSLLKDASGQPISSSQIRRHLQEGKISAAAEALGRPYGLYGQVIPGQQNGRIIGFPTLNLQSDDDLLIPHGVYAGWTLLADGSRHRSAINLGRRPTVAPTNQQARIEAHLLDFQGDLYGQRVEIQPLTFIRAERQFRDFEELQEQIRRDTTHVADIFR